MKYIAYGSNMVQEQMAVRCPEAKLIGTGYISGARLEFYLHATVEATGDKRNRVPVAVWEINDKDERSLDRYEGYPAAHPVLRWHRQRIPQARPWLSNQNGPEASAGKKYRPGIRLVSYPLNTPDQAQPLPIGGGLFFALFRANVAAFVSGRPFSQARRQSRHVRQNRQRKSGTACCRSAPKSAGPYLSFSIRSALTSTPSSVCLNRRIS